MTDTKQPTAEEMNKMTAVAEAGAQSAAEGGDTAAAMRQKADQVNLEISDQELDRIAAALSGKLLEGFEQRGAFDPPPEPVRAPEHAQAPPPPGEAQQPQQPAEPAPAPPKKRTFADRFFGSP